MDFAKQTTSPPPLPSQKMAFYAPLPSKVTLGRMNHQAHADFLPIKLQDQSSFVQFRNVWVTPLWCTMYEWRGTTEEAGDWTKYEVQSTKYGAGFWFWS